MKARLSILLIFLVTFAMAGVLYYVMQHSLEFRAQSQERMRQVLVQNLPKDLGPVQVDGHQASWVLPSDELDWKLELQGELLIVQPLVAQFKTDPAVPDSKLLDLKIHAWSASESILRDKIAEVLKIKKDPASLKILSPTPL